MSSITIVVEPDHVAVRQAVLTLVRVIPLPAASVSRLITSPASPSPALSGAGLLPPRREVANARLIALEIALGAEVVGVDEAGRL
jgi:hypothetical protein